MELDVVQERLPSCLIGVERWRPPEGTMLKVNFDAASNANSMLSCAGIRRLWHALTPFIWLLDFGLREVTIEGDPLTVIRKVRSPLHNALSIGAYIQNVKVMAPLFNRYFFTHASRDSNTVAYLLAITRL
ncbi:hypothetical protein Godav_019497 [Gossypium davidsonii]|uniref:RNase H type-1 domain-containing protein n=1 Tax=Gossypium davidsonii TaxID=34287 RepID=A0A7J8R0Q8_GOSDV|nr:hypothetical protein [Gossypium davidsonii]